jgi:hypothetical protein
MLGNQEQRAYFRERVQSVSRQIQLSSQKAKIISLDRSARPFGIAVGYLTGLPVENLNIGSEKGSRVYASLPPSFECTEEEVQRILARMDSNRLVGEFGQHNMAVLQALLSGVEEAVVLDDFIVKGSTQMLVNSIFRSFSIPEPRFMTFADSNNPLFLRERRTPGGYTSIFPQVPWAPDLLKIFETEYTPSYGNPIPIETDPRCKFVLDIADQDLYERLYDEVVETVG